MRGVHIQRKNLQAVFITEDAVTVIKINRGDNNTSGMMRERNDGILDAIKVIEKIRIIRSAGFGVSIIFVFDLSDTIERPWVRFFRAGGIYFLPALGEGTANFINRTFVGYSTESQYIGAFALAKGFKDVVINQGAVSIRSINVHVTNFDTVFITEAGEDEVPANGVNVDDVCNKSRTGTSHRTTAGTNGDILFMFGPDHKV